MTLDIWKKCHDEKNIKVITETAWRIEPLEEKTSLRKLVDSIEEQKILEEMMRESASEVSRSGLHPLLGNRFKNPPLTRASRFGRKTEPSLWYGALNVETSLVEIAFHRLAFINASVISDESVISQMIAFSVNLKILRGIALHEKPFIKYKNEISSPSSYAVSQLLGANMRKNNIDGFTFISARDVKAGVNVGLFKINAFAGQSPNRESLQTWQCFLTANKAEFVQTSVDSERAFVFPVQDFQVDGKLPFLGI